MHVGGIPGNGEGNLVAQGSHVGIAGIPGHWPPRCLFDVFLTIPPVYRLDIFIEVLDTFVFLPAAAFVARNLELATLAAFAALADAAAVATFFAMPAAHAFSVDAFVAANLL
jgi:hypothetical protein